MNGEFIFCQGIRYEIGKFQLHCSIHSFLSFTKIVNQPENRLTPWSLFPDEMIIYVTRKLIIVELEILLEVVQHFSSPLFKPIFHKRIHHSLKYRVLKISPFNKYPEENKPWNIFRFFFGIMLGLN